MALAFVADEAAAGRERAGQGRNCKRSGSHEPHCFTVTSSILS
jgi:hypothetical protein